MKLLKFNNPNINHWVCSDLHLNHNKEFLYVKRGFNNIEEHNETVLNNINTLVKPDDILFSLGDFCLTTPEDKFEELISRINCKNIYLIWGNHPNPIKKIYYREIEKQYGPDIDVYPYRYKNIVFVGYHLECIIQGKYVVLNHFPIEVWENMKEGSYMLCGHSHYSLERTRKESTDGLTLDCGWEGHNSIYNFNEIVTIMKNKQIRTVDHHVKASAV
jgi:calcineurin-like phosphoesterase family protein